MLVEDAGDPVARPPRKAPGAARDPRGQRGVERLVAAAARARPGVRHHHGQADVPAIVREHGHGKRPGGVVQRGLAGRYDAVHTPGNGLVPALLPLVPNAALAVVVAVGDHEGDAPLDHGQADLPYHGAGPLRALAQGKLHRVALDLVAREHHEVRLRLVESRAEKRHGVLAHVRGLLDVGEL